MLTDKLQLTNLQKWVEDTDKHKPSRSMQEDCGWEMLQIIFVFLFFVYKAADFSRTLNK